MRGIEPPFSASRTQRDATSPHLDRRSGGNRTLTARLMKPSSGHRTLRRRGLRDSNPAALWLPPRVRRPRGQDHVGRPLGDRTLPHRIWNPSRAQLARPISAPGRNRTSGTHVRSAVLYLLSYRGETAIRLGPLKSGAFTNFERCFFTALSETPSRVPISRYP